MRAFARRVFAHGVANGIAGVPELFMECRYGISSAADADHRASAIGLANAVRL
jgi:hypothetical protein